MPIRTDHARGLLITGIGGLFLSFDIPLIRLGQGEPWSVLFTRTGMSLIAALVIWMVWRRLSPLTAPRLIPGPKGMAVGACYGLGSVFFVLAVFHTATANVVFIVAFAPMFAAVLSWLFLAERPRPATLIAMAVMVMGVGILVSESIGTGSLAGDLMAAGCALSIASAITVSRGSGEDMSFTALTGFLLPCALAGAVVALDTGYSVDVPGWVIFNGAVMMPIAFFCLAAGPRWISGPEVAMFYLLETVLAPVWVWMIFGETLSSRSLVGGGILVAALVAHSLWQLAESRRSRTAAARRPA